MQAEEIEMTPRKRRTLRSSVFCTWLLTVPEQIQTEELAVRTAQLDTMRRIRGSRLASAAYKTTALADNRLSDGSVEIQFGCCPIENQKPLQFSHF
ncbi:hypothetical protein EVAR_24277_1 [Eumeta japonica]|uniref:Uncharacterized protein n=1 Tax=Eumeta variegata TaxID=151549 RepID=A0A4C1VHC4_EUMVA|nr:hypothetical protein EVAR_24277_1 [Eumeta japonica]